MVPGSRIYIFGVFSVYYISFLSLNRVSPIQLLLHSFILVHTRSFPLLGSMSVPSAKLTEAGIEIYRRSPGL